MAIYLKRGLVILAGAYMLAACSSSPSPWSQSSSPWGDKNSQAEPAPVAAEEEKSSFVEPVPQAEAAYAPVEPVAVAAVEPVAVETIAEAAPVTNQVATGNDLRSQPATSFAVQVCASRSMKQLAGFAKRHNLSDQLTAQTTVKGETWFVLLEGVYATRDEARQAQTRVSGQVSTKPWIRTIGSLHAVMQ
ncbi:MAG: DamX protein [Pseudomonadota bacterium]|nr:DamX protein [Pseudomonadota bacterium]